MKLWKWQKGRQLGFEYYKFPLWYFRIGRYGFDAYILRYPTQGILPWHTDPVKGKHWRLNIRLRGWATFIMRRNKIYRCFFRQIIVLFRPDLWEHTLHVYEGGCTKLSFGFVKFDK